MTKDLLSALRPALAMVLLFALLLGLAYPLTLTGIGQLLFPRQSNGSLIRDSGKVIGSTVAGQAFTSERYFHSRPSAAGKGYDGLASSGSNLGPASRALSERVKSDLEQIAEPDHPVPSDLVTASASGLDPDISPEAAFYQADRIARARDIPPAEVRALIQSSIAQPFLGFIGEPRVNLFDLNRRLDAVRAKPAA